MVNALSKLLCLVGFHRPMPGVTLRRSIWWACTRCHQLQPGALAAPARRRRSIR